jgi:hypothetical protein
LLLDFLADIAHNIYKEREFSPKAVRNQYTAAGSWLMHMHGHEQQLDSRERKQIEVLHEIKKNCAGVACGAVGRIDRLVRLPEY